jgi:hypothetical protein
MSELASGQTTHSPHDTHHRARRAGRHAGVPAEEVPAVSERVDRLHNSSPRRSGLRVRNVVDSSSRA